MSSSILHPAWFGLKIERKDIYVSEKSEEFIWNPPKNIIQIYCHSWTHVWNLYKNPPLFGINWGTPETPRTSRQYSTTGFKGCSKAAHPPYYTERRNYLDGRPIKKIPVWPKKLSIIATNLCRRNDAFELLLQLR